jgi:hypothetical protein
VSLHCRVLWYNEETAELEPCVVKSLCLDKADTHPNGEPGYVADSLREVATMRQLSKTPGVARFRDMVVEPSGAIHLILE